MCIKRNINSQKARWAVCSINMETANHQCLFHANVKRIRGRRGRRAVYSGFTVYNVKEQKTIFCFMMIHFPIQTFFYFACSKILIVKVNYQLLKFYRPQTVDIAINCILNFLLVKANRQVEVSRQKIAAVFLLRYTHFFFRPTYKDFIEGHKDSF